MSDLYEYTHKSKKIRVGMHAIINSEGRHQGIGTAGDHIEIKVIRKNNGEDVKIGITGGYHDGWHNLEGLVPSHQGYWVTREQIFTCVDLIGEKDLKIKGNLTFKGKKLKGKKCKILSSLEDGSMFVEFDENIGGTSCDGLGHRGHCIVVDPEMLGMKKPITSTFGNE